MFYDEAAKGKLSKSQRQLKLFRFTMTGVMIVLLPPFVMLALAPMMLLLVPVAFVVIPFMIPAFFRGTYTNPVEAGRVRAWNLVPAVAQV